MVEGASIDKQAHTADAERTIWDTIEFDNAVQVALEFADRTNNDGILDNDTLVIVTADHECGGLAIVGVGNERYAPATMGHAVRDYAAVFRFTPTQLLNFVPNYEADAAGYPRDPDPSRKLLLGWAAAPDRYENWLSNRLAQDAAITGASATTLTGTATTATVANPLRDGGAPGADNTTADGRAVPGFLVPGVIENGEHACRGSAECPADISSDGHTFSGHTAADVPLSATGPGALQFTGTYENTDVFVKMLRAAAGSYGPPPVRTRWK
jgi:alkaline phosphatase